MALLKIQHFIYLLLVLGNDNSAQWLVMQSEIYKIQSYFTQTFHCTSLPISPGCFAFTRKNTLFHCHFASAVWTIFEVA